MAVTDAQVALLTQFSAPLTGKPLVGAGTGTNCSPCDAFRNSLEGTCRRITDQR
jgi:hypothetical protein